ncbi:BLOC-1-related complex subunit 6 [Lates japonicus]|uniref:BLOC-1-related complex subunit 6 n=1 Tax=Lates japonicus TaxID=270547 RepID=A0AAD3M1Q3_LATJO|nr:BLOC-1-related complex subunit 6 [Lates japonicus]
MMITDLNGTIQNGMYTLMARCEELDRSMQPIHTLAAQIRDIKRTLDTLGPIYSNRISGTKTHPSCKDQHQAS